MPFDKTKNQRKGFCFITFDSEQVVNELLKTPKQTIKDKEVGIFLRSRTSFSILLALFRFVLAVINRSHCFTGRCEESYAET